MKRKGKNQHTYVLIVTIIILTNDLPKVLPSERVFISPRGGCPCIWYRWRRQTTINGQRREEVKHEWTYTQATLIKVFFHPSHCQTKSMW
jgi:hypothetical protein